MEASKNPRTVNNNTGSNKRTIVAPSAAKTTQGIKNIAQLLFSSTRKIFLPTLSHGQQRHLLHAFRLGYNEHQECVDSVTLACQMAGDDLRSDHYREKVATMMDTADDVSFLEKLLVQKKDEHAKAAAAVAAISTRAEEFEGLKADAFTADGNIKSAIDLLRKAISDGY